MEYTNKYFLLYSNLLAVKYINVIEAKDSFKVTGKSKKLCNYSLLKNTNELEPNGAIPSLLNTNINIRNVIIPGIINSNNFLF